MVVINCDDLMIGGKQPKKYTAFCHIEGPITCKFSVYNYITSIESEKKMKNHNPDLCPALT